MCHCFITTKTKTQYMIVHLDINYCGFEQCNDKIVPTFELDVGLSFSLDKFGIKKNDWGQYFVRVFGLQYRY